MESAGLRRYCFGGITRWKHLKNDLNPRRLLIIMAIKGMVVIKAEVCHCSSIMFDSVAESLSLISFIS